MSYTARESILRESAAYGGLVDAVGGVATVVLAICGLAGVHPPLMAAIATIVFGIALLIQGGAMLSEYAQIFFPPGGRFVQVNQPGGSSLSAIILGGAAGIVLGILALLDIESGVLTPVAIIVFGTALVVSSNAVWHLYMLRSASGRAEGATEFAGRDILASEMASGSAGVQALAGLAALVLGILAVAGNRNDLTLNLVALLVVGATIVVTGSSLSATVLSLMKPSTP
jgi:hypothetical protein